MCRQCWTAVYKSARIDTPAVRAAAQLIDTLYVQPHGTVGGSMHVQLDDWNIEDEYFDERATTFDAEYSADEIAINQQCFDAMKALSVDERASALALERGYWE